MPSKPIGLYANIAAKRERISKGSGEKMRKPGSKGAPTADAFKQSAKTAKMAYGGSMDDAPPRTRYRPAPDAQSYDSDIDYKDSLSGGTSKYRPPIVSVPPTDRDAKNKRKEKIDTAMFTAALKAGDKDAAEKSFTRRATRSRSEGLRKVAKQFPNSAPKMRKQWSDEIGGGKPAPFKEGGMANKPDPLPRRYGANFAYKVPREGQTDMRNIPVGNDPSAPNSQMPGAKAYMDSVRKRSPDMLKKMIKEDLGTHKKPTLPKKSGGKVNSCW